MTDHHTPADFWGEPSIHVYTRAAALADGVLVDVTLAAREAGFCIPVALRAPEPHEVGRGLTASALPLRRGDIVGRHGWGCTFYFYAPPQD